MKRKSSIEDPDHKAKRTSSGTFPVARVAHVGEEHSFSHLAAKNYFETRSHTSRTILNYNSVRRTEDVFDAVESGACHYGVLRIESSSVGTVHLVYDLLFKHSSGVGIVGEIGELEKICVCAKSRISDIDITKVYGRVDILGAGNEYLDAVDTKRASAQLPLIDRVCSTCPASTVKNCDDLGAIALTSESAGLFHGLTQIHPNVVNDRNSQCRYIIIAKMIDGTAHDPLLVGKLEHHSQRKTSLVIALDNSAGSIFKMSSCFALRDIGILKIESRPATTALSLTDVDLSALTKKHWNFIFYVDIKPSASDAVNEAALRSLKDFCPWFRVLGTYESRLKPTEASVGESWASILDVATL